MQADRPDIPSADADLDASARQMDESLLRRVRGWLSPQADSVVAPVVAPALAQGPTPTPAQGRGHGPGATLSGRLFFPLLGAVYLLAFLSLWPQLLGLIGSRGMLPAAPYLRAVAAQLGAERYFLLPTLFWLGSSDTALLVVCGLGIVASVLVLFGRLVWPALLLAVACYLSFLGVGRDFMGFQWDGLLIETGVLALLAHPVRPLMKSKSKPKSKPQPAGAMVPVGRWLLLWLIARFMWSAGWAKLRSGDPTWRDLSALHFHFETQPLPTLLGYYAHQLPGVMKKLSVVLMFVIELGVPLLLLVPRLRRHAFLPFVALMVIIAATGNYGFFNALSGVLFVLLLPDAWLRRWLPAWLLRRLEGAPPPAAETPVPRLAPVILRGFVATLLGVAGLVQAAELFVPHRRMPKLLRAPVTWLQPFHVSNRYGLFAVMTTERPEIVIEGSTDGQTWRAYEFKYKPGDPLRPPRWNAPHQPRLDWQMWFAAMGSPEDSPWLQGLCVRLLQGSPDVLWLLAHDPFAGKPPRYLRATLYRYRFTELAERRKTGAYWQRTDPQPYIGPVSLQD